MQLRPKADRVTAGGVSHRIADIQARQARRATQCCVSIVSPIRALNTLAAFPEPDGSGS